MSRMSMFGMISLKNCIPKSQLQSQLSSFVTKHSWYRYHNTTVNNNNININNGNEFDLNDINFNSSEIIEPFKIKMTEPIQMLSKESRKLALESANYNLFKLRSEDVTIDLLTDSGTCSMSQDQWSSMIGADESYANSRSWYKFKDAIESLTGYNTIIPTHQGRASEKLLFSTILNDFNSNKNNNNNNNNNNKSCIPGNTHFDTTRANIEYNFGIASDFIEPVSQDTQAEHPFKGNIDLKRLEDYLFSEQDNIDDSNGNNIKYNYENVPLIVCTVTNNSCGGQPVSMENMEGLRNLVDKIYNLTGHKIYIFVDCARFAENSWFIKQREEKWKNYSCEYIAQEMFKLFDGGFMSMKKDAFGNTGGFLAFDTQTRNTDDKQLNKWIESVKNLGILTEGFPTYGGLAGRDLEALAVGLKECLQEDYLKYRTQTTKYLFNKLDESNVPMLRPPGGHAIYLDAKKFMDNNDDSDDNNIACQPEYCQAQALSVALYLVGGIRSVEVGTVMFGKTDPNTGLQKPHNMELVRLAFPRRVYTQSHINYVADVINYVYKNKEKVIKPLKIKQEPQWLRHFTCDFELHNNNTKSNILS